MPVPESTMLARSEAGNGVGGEEREDAHRLGDAELHRAPGKAAEEEQRHKGEPRIERGDHADVGNAAGAKGGVCGVLETGLDLHVSLFSAGGLYWMPGGA